MAGGEVSHSSPESPEVHSNQPMYDYPPSKYTSEQILEILLHTEETKRTPTLVTHNTSYECGKCLSASECFLLKEDFRIWKYSVSHPVAD